MDSDEIVEGRNDDVMRKFLVTLDREIMVCQYQEVEAAGDDDAERGAVPAVEGEDFDDEEWEDSGLWVPRVTWDEDRSRWVVVGPILSGRYEDDPDPDLGWMKAPFSDKTSADEYAEVLGWFFRRELQYVPSVETLEDLRHYRAGTGPYAQRDRDDPVVSKLRRVDWAKNGF